MKLIRDLREFIELLNSENVRYLVIGGWAYNRYAEPRFTGDIDFFVSSSSENQTRLRAVLIQFGFGEALPQGDKSLFEKKIVMLGRPPSRIDLLSEVDGLEFEVAYKNSVGDELDSIPVRFVSLADLIKNKRASGRDKDLVDVKNLEALKR